jgi:hypothetical protein
MNESCWDRFDSYERIFTGGAAMEPYQWFLLGMMAAWTPSVVVFAVLVARPLTIGKQASVATEPDIHLDGPKMLADTLTREKMSEAPVDEIVQVEANGLNAEQKLLAQLEAENAELRDRVVDLMLQIQLRRDGASSHRSPRPLLRTVKSP